MSNQTEWSSNCKGPEVEVCLEKMEAGKKKKALKGGSDIYAGKVIGFGLSALCLYAQRCRGPPVPPPIAQKFYAMSKLNLGLAVQPPHNKAKKKKSWREEIMSRVKVAVEMV